MKINTTAILRIAIVLISMFVLGLCLLMTPAFSQEGVEYGYLYVVIGIYLSAIPFFSGLYAAWRMLGYIDKQQAFSTGTKRELTRIKFYALSITAIYALGLPLLYQVAQKDDAPGVLAIGIMVVFASFVVAAFAALMEKVLQSALDIKAENELTV